MHFVPLVVVVLVFWILVFFLMFKAQGSSALDFFLGKRAPLPPNLGSWVDCGLDPSRGKIRQERWLLPEGQDDPSHLLLQVRFFDPTSGEVVEVLPQQRVKRGRSKSS